MVGKLDLNLGLDYAFDIRRARQVAEGRAILADSTVIDGAAVPVTGVNAGASFDMTWFADGVAITVTHVSVGTETKPEVLAALAALALADASVSAVDSNNEVVLLLTAGPELTAGTINLTPGQSGGGVGPDPVGPYASVHGAPWWHRVKASNGHWQVGWNIDSDPEADIWRKLTGFLNDSSITIDYRVDVREKAYELGWDGVS